MVQNLFLVTKNLGIIAGYLLDNHPHKHFSVQITVSQKPFRIITEHKSEKTNGVIIASNVLHQVQFTERQQSLLINCNPFGNIGLWCRKQLDKKSTVLLPHPIKISLLQLLKDDQIRQDNADHLESLLENIIFNHEPNTLHSMIDPRILRCIEEIGNKDDTVSARQMADLLHLSESSFLHIFKEQTGLTYRRMILWVKLFKSFQYHHQFSNLTQLAHHCGFSDSAHFSRTFRETFGISPRFLIKNSRFIQE